MSRDPLWSKAPLALLRFPRLLFALAFGAFLLVLAIAIEPLFVSAEASHLVEAKIAKPSVTRYGAGLLFKLRVEKLVSPDAPSGTPPSPTDIGREFSARTEGVLEPVVSSVLGPGLTAVSHSSPTRTATVKPFAGTEALEHVHVLQRGSGTGLWASGPCFQSYPARRNSPTPYAWSQKCWSPTAPRPWLRCAGAPCRSWMRAYPSRRRSRASPWA